LVIERILAVFMSYDRRRLLSLGIFIHADFRLRNGVIILKITTRHADLSVRSFIISRIARSVARVEVLVM
jgi:hypothetical protein